ncbi:MAG TPA: DMT family transporter [Firmicutes bacterium]|jgi:drug/metabolite transporter (DMT)-like permease|nr:DMT family transporter [Bacillota bacterium]
MKLFPQQESTRTLTRWQADGLLLLVALFWGATFALIKQAVATIAPFSFLGMRFLLAFVIVIALYPRRLCRHWRPTLKAGLATGTVLFAGFALQTVGLLYSTAAKAAFITGLAVVFVPLLAFLLQRRLPHPGAVCGILLATSGLGLLSFSGTAEDLASGALGGDFLLVLCAVAFALQVIMVDHHARRCDPIALGIIQIGTVAGLGLVCAFLWELSPGPQVLHPQVMTAILFTAIFATSVAFLLQSGAQRFTTHTDAALVLTMEPVFGALCAYLLLGETLTMVGWAGAGLIALGMVLSELARNHYQNRTEALREDSLSQQ